MTSTELEREIEILRRRYLHLLEEVSAWRQPPCVWDLRDEMLCWHVVLREVHEPDLDVEVLGDALVIRGCLEMQTDHICQALLPVPSPFDPRRASIVFRAGVLEVRIPARAGGRRGR